MKTMKTFSRRIAALLLIVTVGITALAPAASASNIQLPSLPKNQCVVDDAGVLSDSTTSELETLNAQLSSSWRRRTDRRTDRGLHRQRHHRGLRH